eukprot:scaffold32569_cov112-Isochrysis_galbana.AAC.4
MPDAHRPQPTAQPQPSSSPGTVSWANLRASGKKRQSRSLSTACRATRKDTFHDIDASCSRPHPYTPTGDPEHQSIDRVHVGVERQ